MKERGELVVGGLVLLLLIFPLGFLVHVSPRFPGSLPGSLVGIAGAVLMLVPFAYLVVKRAPGLQRRVTRRVSMRTLLAIHVYAGVLGPILGMVHAAHKFESPIGVSLTGMMLVVVISGYTGRYLLGQTAKAVRGRRANLAAVKAALARTPADPRDEHHTASASLLDRLRRTFLAPEPAAASKQPASRRSLAEAAADLEFAVRAEAVVNDLFGRWLKLHIVIAMILYALLALHVWSGLYYGLRWT